MNRIRCLCRARRARSRGVVCSSGVVVVVVGVDFLVGSVSLEWCLNMASDGSHWLSQIR